MRRATRAGLAVFHGTIDTVAPNAPSIASSRENSKAAASTPRSLDAVVAARTGTGAVAGTR